MTYSLRADVSVYNGWFVKVVDCMTADVITYFRQW